MPNRIEAAI